MLLSAKEIRRRMSLPFPDRLVVTPLLADHQLRDGEAGIDVRLGQDFIVAERAALDRIDPLNIPPQHLTGYLRRVRVPIGDAFVLHPRQFALGATLEYCRLPYDLAADVIGRSRWARVGLVIAMATFVQPGYAGCLTLELQNLGDLPLDLYPGLPIAQLVVYESMRAVRRRPSQFHCSIGPEFPDLVDRSDRLALESFQNEFTRLSAPWTQQADPPRGRRRGTRRTG